MEESNAMLDMAWDTNAGSYSIARHVNIETCHAVEYAITRLVSKHDHPSTE